MNRQVSPSSISPPSISRPFIPLVDLKAQRDTIRAEIEAAILRVIDRCDFILGEDLHLFERQFAAYCGIPHAIGVANGTDALHLACRALGIGPGDEVIIPAMTFIATALGVTQAGATPVLVDVRSDNGLIDVAQIEAAITPRTKAILPVHLFGQCADMSAVMAIARSHDLKVIEDSAQAHGAWHEGRRAGAFGDVACFSFYPGKNLGAYGDGGAVTTGNPDWAERLQLLRNWGSRRKYHHEEFGYNSRLDTLQAAILSVKLAHLDTWNNARRSIARRYDQAFRGHPDITLTRYAEGSAYHLYVVRVENRDDVLATLNRAGVGAGIHYPYPLHALKAYQGLNHPQGSFPVAEDWSRRCLSLPIFAELGNEDVVVCIEELLAAVNGQQRGDKGQQA